MSISKKNILRGEIDKVCDEINLLKGICPGACGEHGSYFTSVPLYSYYRICEYEKALEDVKAQLEWARTEEFPKLTDKQLACIMRLRGGYDCRLDTVSEDELRKLNKYQASQIIDLLVTVEKNIRNMRLAPDVFKGMLEDVKKTSDYIFGAA